MMAELKTFRIGDLFTLISNPQLDKSCFTFSTSGQYPYFTRTEANNGILGYVDYLDDEHLIAGNSLAVGMISMRFHYMHHDFYAGQFTKTLIPEFDGFNERVALFFIAQLNSRSHFYRAFLVREFAEKVLNTELALPVTVSGELDLDEIEERVRELEAERVRELEAERVRELEAYLIASGLNDYELTEEEKETLSLSLKNPHLTKLQIQKLLLSMGGS